LYESISALAFWLGWINAILAGFNLIPGFPLNGGRVLRSLLWWRSGNVLRAIKTASNVGIALGYLFILSGIGLLFWGYLLDGIWIALIGWFLQNAASGSYRQAALHNMLRGHTVDEVMSRDCSSLSPDISLEHLVQHYFLGSGKRCFPVIRNGHVTGLITVHDVRKIPRNQWPYRTVSDIMTPFEKLKWVKPGDDLSDVVQVMSSGGVSQLPVVEEGNVVGMIARDNLMSFFNVRTELGIAK
jgi:CBS domain-containing protein